MTNTLLRTLNLNYPSMVQSTLDAEYHFEALREHYEQLQEYCERQARKNGVSFSSKTLLKRDYDHVLKGKAREIITWELVNDEKADHDHFIAAFTREFQGKTATVSVKVSALQVMENLALCEKQVDEAVKQVLIQRL